MHHHTRAAALCTADLQRLLGQFLDRLAEQGYAERTVRQYRQLLNRIIGAADGGTLTPDELTAMAAAMASKAASPSTGELWRTAGRVFRAWLHQTGAVPAPAPAPAAPSELDILRTAFRDWLLWQRGLAGPTVRDNIMMFDRFMRFRFGTGAVRPEALASADIDAFFDPAEDRRHRGKPSQLRNLLRFLFQSGRTQQDLSLHVPSDRRRRAETERLRLDQDEVERILDAARGDSLLEMRNHAMLLMAARLGLRAGEVTAIRLGDIRWRAGEIVIRGKGARRDAMPLPVDVGEAVVRYIRHARRGSSRHLFVSVRAPWHPVGARPVQAALRRAVARALPARKPARCGVHALRHALATSLLRRGSSFDEVGNVLRHRSRATTMIYARYDIDALRPLAPEWPSMPGAGA